MSFWPGQTTLFVIHGCIMRVSVGRGFTVYRSFLLTILPEYRTWPQIPFSVSARISFRYYFCHGGFAFGCWIFCQTGNVSSCHQTAGQSGA